MNPFRLAGYLAALILMILALWAKYSKAATIEEELVILQEELYKAIQSTEPDSVELFSKITDAIQLREDFLAKAGRRYIVVNKSTYMLSAIIDGREALSAKVIVGRKEQPTPNMESTISDIIINPHWTVSQNTALLVTVPRFVKNPSYANAMGYVIYSDWSQAARRLDATKINWEKHLDKGVIPFKLYQKPGKFNELGDMKFLVPNPSGREETRGIFIHGTPYTNLFDKEVREFSSGCIRIEDTKALADVILGNPTATYLRQELDKGRTKRYKVEKPIKFFIVDWQVSISPNNELVVVMR